MAMFDKLFGKKPAPMTQRRMRQESGTEDLSDDEKIIREAKDRFKRAWDWESQFRVRYIDDVKFNAGDSENLWQWPEWVQRSRNSAGSQRPMLTINKTQRLCAMITNDARKNRPSIDIRPTNNLSSYQSAQVYEGVIRNIEYISNAYTTYDEAMESQVEGGIGYWRVNTRYVSDDSFDQEIIIEPFADQLGVFLDCDIKQKDGSDALWGFVFEEMAEDEFERQYPDVPTTDSTGINEYDDWWTQEGKVRVAEYYRIQQEEDVLIYMKDGDDEATFFKSDIPKKWRDKIPTDSDESENFKTRKVYRKKLQWFKIAANQIIERNDLPGPYIPIVRVVGFERRIDQKLERKGFVRGLKDAQRMYNYNSSGSVEFGALQSKVPWVGAAAAFAGNETDWNTANTTNKAYLTFNHLDAEGDLLPPEALPQRPQPPGSSPVFLDGMKIADNEMSMISGQENAGLGRDGNERSGVAIDSRKLQGETATYHFIDNFAKSVRHTGKIIIAWFPHVYDTKRVVQILGRDGKQTNITMDPKAEGAYQEQKDPNADVVNVLFNPTVGKYEVEADIGPAYATQRQQAWNAFVNIVTGAPDLINEIGDLMFQAADFPMADEISERIKRKIRKTAPWLLDDNSMDPMTQQLQQQISDMGNQIAELLQRVAEQNLIIRGKDQKRDVDAYRAETDRMGTIANTIVDLMKVGDTDAAKAIIDKTVQDMLSDDDITDEVDKSQATYAPDKAQADNQPSPEGYNGIPPGAIEHEGNHYVPHPEQEGQWLRVVKPEEYDRA